jgi:hypothetical protein
LYRLSFIFSSNNFGPSNVWYLLVGAATVCALLLRSSLVVNGLFFIKGALKPGILTGVIFIPPPTCFLLKKKSFQY